MFLRGGLAPIAGALGLLTFLITPGLQSRLLTGHATFLYHIYQILAYDIAGIACQGPVYASVSYKVVLFFRDNWLEKNQTTLLYSSFLHQLVVED